MNRKIEQLEKINKILSEVGKRDGINGLTLNAEGTGGLELENRVKLFFEYVEESERLYLYTPLMDTPRDDARRLRLYEAMLDCNFLNLICSRGSLALFSPQEQAVYQIWLDVNRLDANLLDAEIDALLQFREQILYRLDYAKNKQKDPVQSSHSSSSTLNRLLSRSPFPSR